MKTSQAQVVARAIEQCIEPRATPNSTLPGVHLDGPPLLRNSPCLTPQRDRWWDARLKGLIDRMLSGVVAAMADTGVSVELMTTQNLRVASVLAEDSTRRRLLHEQVRVVEPHIRPYAAPQRAIAS